ncbi:MAG: YlbF family regulator [Nanobdellota archaeon]
MIQGRGEKMDKEAIKKAEEFAEEIIRCKEYKEFLQADKALKNRSDSMKLIDELDQKQQETRYNASSDVMGEIKELQEKIKNDKIIQELLRTQNELIRLLRETNTIISEKIDSPFAFPKGGGCCG